MPPRGRKKKKSATVDASFFEAGKRFFEGNKEWEVVKVEEFIPPEEEESYNCVFYFGVKANPNGAPPIEECEYTPVDELASLVQAALDKKAERKKAKKDYNDNKRLVFDASEEDDLPVSAYRAYVKQVKNLEAQRLPPQKHDRKLAAIRKEWGMSTKKVPK